MPKHNWVGSPHPAWYVGPKDKIPERCRYAEIEIEIREFKRKLDEFLREVISSKKVKFAQIRFEPYVCFTMETSTPEPGLYVLTITKPKDWKTRMADVYDLIDAKQYPELFFISTGKWVQVIKLQVMEPKSPDHQWTPNGQGGTDAQNKA